MVNQTLILLNDNCVKKMFFFIVVDFVVGSSVNMKWGVKGSRDEFGDEGNNKQW